MPSPRLASVIVFAALVAPGAAHAAAGAYKWTDEHGVVHYSDHIPAEAVSRGSVMLDKQGRTVQKVEPALTPEQRAAKSAEVERRQTQEKLQEDQLRRDRALMQSYTSEEEIDLARNRAMSTVEAQLKSAQSYVTDLSKRQRELDAQKREYSNKPVPAALERELAGIDEELARQNELIGQKKQEIGTIAVRYDADKKRWQELRREGIVLPASSDDAKDAKKNVSSAASTAPAPAAAPYAPTPAKSTPAMTRGASAAPR